MEDLTLILKVFEYSFGKWTFENAVYYQDTKNWTCSMVHNSSTVALIIIVSGSIEMGKDQKNFIKNMNPWEKKTDQSFISSSSISRFIAFSN